jgi:hypothetical protein
MTWVKFDDGFPEHPKVLGLSDTAFSLHVRAICYAARNLTDGIIPRVWLKGAKAAILLAVQQLIEARLWTEHPDGWEVHDYLQYQPSRAKVEQQREQNNTRVKRHRNALQPRDCNGSETTPRPVPSRPEDPINRSDLTGALPVTPPARATSAAGMSPLAWGNKHSDHISGFCDWMCFPSDLAGQFASRFNPSDPDAGLVDVRDWAKSVRRSWEESGRVPAGTKWYDWWNDRWTEAHGDGKPVTDGAAGKQRRTREALTRFVEHG